MSNNKISLLSEIHDKEMGWNAKVLVSRVWHFRLGGDDGPTTHTDIVVLDQEDTHMYGQFPAELSERLKDVLKEGSVYLMKRFMCKQSKQTYRAVESPYMMQFTRFSTVVPAPGNEEDYPYRTYNPISFSDIPVPGPRTPRFLDVVAQITAVTDIVVVHSQHQPEPSDTRTIVLQDQSGNEISLFLWGARAREFEAGEVHAASELGAVIAIFVGTLPKMYRGIKGLSGSSACRWYIDEDLPEINAFRASLPAEIAPVTAHIPGEQPMVAAPVREPPAEISVRELLDVDPYDNLKKQFLVKIVVTRLGSDHRWWFLSCRKCHKSAYVSGRQERCGDTACPSIDADPSYCVCTFGSDGTAEAEFMWFDKAARSVVGGGDVVLPVEISRIVTQKYELVVTVSNKSFNPTSTQLSFQVIRINRTFKPELAPLGSSAASNASGASSSAGVSGVSVAIPTSFPVGSSTLTVLPLDEMNTPISAFRGKGQAIMPKTPSKSPCPKSSRRTLFASPSKDDAVELPASTANVATQAENSASAGDAVEATAISNEIKQVDQEPEATAREEGKNVLADQTKSKRASIAAKGAGGLKKARQ